MRLYQAGSEYLKHNNGVLIYYQGRMINRLQN